MIKSADDSDGVKERYYVASNNEDQMLMEIRKLRDNKRYNFWVTAATSLGLGKPSKMVDVIVSTKGSAYSFKAINKITCKYV